MKRNLLKGIVLISVIVALTSCSSTQKVASTDVLSDDDVYYTKAKAGDVIDYADAGYQQQQNNYDGYYNDDYYYYGDYASRINRFGYFSPFNYGYNYSWGSPYSSFSMGLGGGRWFSPWGYGYRSLYSPYYGGYGYGSSPWGFGYDASPWGFGNGYYAGIGLGFGYGPGWYGSGWGYDPFYSAFGYGPYYGLGPWGYGAGYYGGYGYGGGYYGGLGGYGYGTTGYARQRPRPTYANGQAGRPGYNNGAPNGSPGRRPNSANGNTTQTNSTIQSQRAVRPVRDDFPTRPTIQTQSTQSSSSSSSGGGGGGSSSGGGGGRPVRP